MIVPVVALPVEGAGGVAVTMTVPMAVGMPMPALAHVTQTRERDPAAKADQRDTRHGIDDVAERRRERHTRDPNGKAKNQGGSDVPDAGLQGGARGFGA